MGKIRHSRRKRVFDLVLATFALAVLLPLLSTLGLILKLSSPGGPVLFRHKRVGRGGRLFRVYKFRTMVPNAETVLKDLLASNPRLRAEWDREFKLRRDPRIIPGIGAIMRKTSLDELPQLINIIRGEMSFVGPRPVTTSEVEKYGDNYETLISVDPGLTGAWQVSGRNDISYEQRVALDMQYIREISIGHDFRIIRKTIGVVLRRSGAY